MRLKTLKPAAGAQACAPARGPRRLRRPGQDLRPRRQGPARPQGRLPQGRLRRRPDAAAAPPAEGRLPLEDQARPAPKCACTSSAKVEGAVVDLAALKKAEVVPVCAEKAKVILSGEIKKAVTLKGSRRPRARGRRSRRPAASSRSSAKSQSQRMATIDQQSRRRSRRCGPFRRDPQPPAVPDRRADRVPHRHVHSGAGHQSGRGGALLQRPVEHASSASSTCSRAARCRACRSSPWA